MALYFQVHSSCNDRKVCQSKTAKSNAQRYPQCAGWLKMRQPKLLQSGLADSFSPWTKITTVAQWNSSSAQKNYWIQYNNGDIGQKLQKTRPNFRSISETFKYLSKTAASFFTDGVCPLTTTRTIYIFSTKVLPFI